MPGTIPHNPFVAMLDAIPWQPVDAPVPAVAAAAPDVPHVTHEGFLTVGAARLRVLRLSDGQRVTDRCHSRQERHEAAALIDCRYDGPRTGRGGEHRGRS